MYLCYRYIVHIHIYIYIYIHAHAIYSTLMVYPAIQVILEALARGRLLQSSLLSHAQLQLAESSFREKHCCIIIYGQDLKKKLPSVRPFQ